MEEWATALQITGGVLQVAGVIALEMVTVAGSDTMIRATANLTLIRIAELDHASLPMIGAIQRDATHRVRASDKYQQTWSELGDALESFGRAIRNSPVMQGRMIVLGAETCAHVAVE